MRPFTEIIKFLKNSMLNNLNGKDLFYIETTCQYWQYVYIFKIMTSRRGELSCG